ncbi:MAG TPA: ScyD/ScyE family protein [Thermomicrobiales bacterium]|nr:ScyD/ScyE family protein [Thermomicrobiales bacterium]
MLRHRRLALLFALGALLLGLVAAGAAGAAPAAPSAAGAPSAAPPPGGTPVITGLAGAFFFALGDDGALYTYDGGSGDTEVYPPRPDTPPAPENPGPPQPLVRGLTGRVLRVAPDGTQRVVAAGLPSYQGYGGATGMALAHGALWALFSPSMAAYYGAAPYPAEGHLARIDLATGAVAPVADLAAYEREHNPDGSDVNPNPYGLAAGPDGALYVADAGANDLLRVDPATGAIGVVAVFPPLPATAPNPLLDGRPATQAVPTGVAVAPGGGFYVANLPGAAGAPPPGSGRVVHVAPDGTVSAVARGFTFATGVAVGPDGRVYVAELVGGFGPPAAPGGPPTMLPGRVSRLLPDGGAEVVVDGLDTPNGIAFDRAGALYVATGVASFGPPPPSPAGAILRFDAVGTPTSPSPSPAAPSPSSAPMPGLPNTGAGGAAAGPAPALPLGLGLALFLGGGLARRWRARRT